MSLWHCLILSLVLQAAVLTMVAWGRHAAPAVVLRLLPAAAAAGVTLGLFFDYGVAGAAGIFSYRGETGLGFHLVNGAVSYGLVAATAALLPVRIDPRRPDPMSNLSLGLALAAALGLGWWFDGLLWVRFVAVGAAILAAGELLLAGFGSLTGPIAALIGGRAGPLAKLWLWSAGLGAVYEFGNLLCPVWQWTPLPGLPDALQEPMIIAFGYVVLIHPMLTAMLLLAHLGGRAR